VNVDQAESLVRSVEAFVASRQRTLRDEFAMAVMPIVAGGMAQPITLPADVSAAKFAASLAYALADAMMEARK
jgi:hypothetical protein